MKLSTGVFQIDASNCSPAAAVPARAKIPAPIIAPIPRQVRSNAVSERFIKRSGACASRIRWSGFLVRKSCEAIRCLIDSHNVFGSTSILTRASCHRLGPAVNANFQRRSYIGAALAAQNDMPDVMSQMSGANLIGNLLFGSIGFVAFVYGKRMTAWKMMFCGLAMMAVPYFIADTAIMYAFGLIGTGVLFF